MNLANQRVLGKINRVRQSHAAHQIDALQQRAGAQVKSRQRSVLITLRLRTDLQILQLGRFLKLNFVGVECGNIADVRQVGAAVQVYRVASTHALRAHNRLRHTCGHLAAGVDVVARVAVLHAEVHCLRRLHGDGGILGLHVLSGAEVDVVVAVLVALILGIQHVAAAVDEGFLLLCAAAALQVFVRLRLHPRRIARAGGIIVIAVRPRVGIFVLHVAVHNRGAYQHGVVLDVRLVQRFVAQQFLAGQRLHLFFNLVCQCFLHHQPEHAVVTVELVRAVERVIPVGVIRDAHIAGVLRAEAAVKVVQVGHPDCKGGIFPVDLVRVHLAGFAVDNVGKLGHARIGEHQIFGGHVLAADKHVLCAVIAQRHKFDKHVVGQHMIQIEMLRKLPQEDRLAVFALGGVALSVVGVGRRRRLGGGVPEVRPLANPCEQHLNVIVHRLQSLVLQVALIGVTGFQRVDHFFVQNRHVRVDHLQQLVRLEEADGVRIVQKFPFLALGLVAAVGIAFQTKGLGVALVVVQAAVARKFNRSVGIGRRVRAEQQAAEAPNRVLHAGILLLRGGLVGKESVRHVRVKRVGVVGGHIVDLVAQRGFADGQVVALGILALQRILYLFDNVCARLVQLGISVRLPGNLLHRQLVVLAHEFLRGSALHVGFGNIVAACVLVQQRKFGGIAAVSVRLGQDRAALFLRALVG